MLFGLFAERTLRYAHDDPDAFEGMVQSIQIHGPDLLKFGIVDPLAQLAANKDFAGRTIISRSLQDRTPKNQYDEQTTILAKFAGEMMSHVPGFKGKGISPKKIDHVLKSFTGIIWQLSTPLQTLERRFIADSAYSDRTLNDFYTAKQELTTKRADLKMENKKLTGKDAINMRIFNKVSPQLTDYFAQIRKETDKKKAREIREKANELATKALKHMK
jgi:hypothetical protein